MSVIFKCDRSKDVIDHSETAVKTKMLDNWIQLKCTQCRYFKKRKGKQRLDRCRNKEVTTGKYSKETLSGMYYCSEFETFEMFLSKRYCPLTAYPTNCKDKCTECIYAANVKGEVQMAIDSGDNRYER